MNGIITLTTDFGLRDAYVGIMKGVILGISPAARMVDLTHDLPPQDIRAASFCLMAAHPYFPSGTIHLAVVDPGVGSERKAVAIALEDAILVGPDNGLFTGFLKQKTILRAVVLDCPEFRLSRHPGNTFHGRDIFAPAAAHLSTGIDILRLGTPIDPETLIRLEFPSWMETAEGYSGAIQTIDSFGTLVTNIPGTVVKGKQWIIKASGRRIPGGKTYGDALPGALIALEGSHGFIEIAANLGSAQKILSMKVDEPVLIELVRQEEGGAFPEKGK